MKRGIRAGVHTAVWCVLVAMVAVLVVSVGVPRAAGATPYTILSGSMQPTLAPGTLVVVKPRPFDEIEIGDVITYQLVSGEDTVATHRVVGIASGGDGRDQLITRGDANAATDPDPVRAEQVRGVVWYQVPVVGRAGSVLDIVWRQRAVTGVGLLLLAYAGFAFAGAARDRRARVTTPSDHQETVS